MTVSLASELVGLGATVTAFSYVLVSSFGHRRGPLTAAALLLLLVTAGGHFASLIEIWSGDASFRGLEDYTRFLQPLFWLMVFHTVVQARTGEALEASDQRFRSTFERAPVGIAHIALDHRCLRINERFCDLLGKPRMALQGKRFDAFPLEEELSAPRRAIAGDDDVARYREIRVRCKGGGALWLNLSTRLVIGAGLSEGYLVVIAEDITEPKHVARALRHSEARLRDFTEVASDWVWEMGPDLRYTYLSERIEDVLGVPASSFVGRSGVEVADGDETADVCGHIADLGARRPFREFVYSRMSAGGGRKWISTSGKPIFSADGDFIGYRGAARDVTAEMEALESVKQSELRFKLAVHGTREGLWDWDILSDRIWFSTVWWEIIGIEGDPDAQNAYSWREYIHPDDLPKFQSGLKEHLRRGTEVFESTIRHWHPDGRWLWVEARGRYTFDGNGRAERFSGRLTDVTARHDLEEKLAFQATHDSLTGLVNRGEFERRLVQAVAEARSGSAQHALCYMDLDQFKVLNDTSGHAAGDEMLRQLGDWLSDRTQDSDLLARLGGDEFAVLMFRASLQEAEQFARALRDAIARFRFCWDDQSYTVGVSVGVVAITADTPDAMAVLGAADAACYTAKDEGRNRVHVYHEGDIELARRQGEMRWAARVQSALDDDRLRLYCQPISRAGPADNTDLHYEVLVRMMDESGNLVMPNSFLPPAERYGLVTRLDCWVVTAAFDWLCDNPSHVRELGLCSINLSGVSLGAREVLTAIDRGLSRGIVPPEKLCFEVTETAAVRNLARARRFMKTLRGWGCLFALDDFGTGVSSFSYLKNLPVDFLKIDGEFVRGILTDPTQLALVRSINDIGHVMGKRTIAEFVETSEVREKLADIGVDYIQGHVLGRPRPLEHFVTAARASKSAG